MSWKHRFKLRKKQLHLKHRKRLLGKRDTQEQKVYKVDTSLNDYE